jgi:hypothetical protein
LRGEDLKTFGVLVKPWCLSIDIYVAGQDSAQRLFSQFESRPDAASARSNLKSAYSISSPFRNISPMTPYLRSVPLLRE